MHLGILVFQIKIMLFLSFFVFYNVQVLFHVIFSLISVYAFHFLYYTHIIMFLSCLSMFLLFIMFS
jgi:hypothetical protein